MIFLNNMFLVHLRVCGVHKCAVCGVWCMLYVVWCAHECVMCACVYGARRCGVCVVYVWCACCGCGALLLISCIVAYCVMSYLFVCVLQNLFVLFILFYCYFLSCAVCVGVCVCVVMCVCSLACRGTLIYVRVRMRVRVFLSKFPCKFIRKT